MGSDEVKYYFAAYRSIKFVKEKTSHMEGTVDNIYLVDIKTIPKFLEILNKHKILKYISDLTKKSEVNGLEKKLKDDFGDYELENNIELLSINDSNYKNFLETNFILVDKDFLKNMKLENKINNSKYKIIVNKDEMKIELTDDLFIKIDETEKKGIYKFGETEEKLIVNEGSYVGDKEEQKDEEMDPEVLMFRVNPDDIKKEEEKKEDEKEENKGENLDNNENVLIDEENNNDENNNNLISLNSVENSQNKKEKAQIAKFDEIIKLIFYSLRKSEENDQKICEAIQKKKEELNFPNELKFQNYRDIIKNIATSITTLFDNFGLNPNLKNLDISLNSDFTYLHNDESQDLLQESNNNNQIRISLIDKSVISNDQKKNFNPFNYTKVKVPFNQCNVCNNNKDEKNEGENFYEINLNQEIDNLDGCFKLKFQKICEKCKKNNLEYIYKFETTPEILIIIFAEPKDKKKFITSNLIEENIDLKAHLLFPNDIDNNKYKLLKVLYVFNDVNDEYLYVNIPEEEKNEYIPYIVFYIKKD